MSFANAVSAELIAVIVAVSAGQPLVLTIPHSASDALPSGPFELGHRSLQHGLRAWVEQRTHRPVGYLEQLYTFADSDRTRHLYGHRTISISYLGLTRQADSGGAAEPGWRGWYGYFPWEDHRAGPPRLIAETLAPALDAWAETAPDTPGRAARRQRAATAFGLERRPWNEELALQRYELLYEAGLVAEAQRGAGPNAGAPDEAPPLPGAPMAFDHRRILATGIARLRAKIKYRPVIFELMPDSFTLLQLQRCVEAIAGLPVHKQNFRRLVEQQELVEETGAMAAETGGRPAKLFRFRREIVAERAAGGTKPPMARA